MGILQTDLKCGTFEARLQKWGQEGKAEFPQGKQIIGHSLQLGCRRGAEVLVLV